ncbi:MAG: hypothetical protein LBD15_02205, partial [Holosporales bacterium]|nr:hypothetical protein [Holosporales bacterium]
RDLLVSVVLSLKKGNNTSKMAKLDQKMQPWIVSTTHKHNPELYYRLSSQLRRVFFGLYNPAASVFHSCAT